MSTCLYIFIQCNFLLMFTYIGKEKLNVCDIKMLPSEEYIIGHKSSVCDFKIRNVKYSKRKFVTMRMIWKLHDDCIRKDFSFYWLVRFRRSMYRNTLTQVTANGSVCNYFSVQVKVHQGSVLSPLLFIIVLEALLRGIRSGCHKNCFMLMIWSWSQLRV